MVGGEPALKTLKEAVAMGADKGYLVEGGWDDAFDPMRTARSAGRGWSDELDAPDLVMCGLVSEDGYSGVTGPALAQLLDWPYLAPVVGLSVEDAAVEAVLEHGVGVAHGEGHPAVRRRHRLVDERPPPALPCCRS